MAKEFDIFLCDRLTECDLLIESIPYHDGISVTNRLILEAALRGCVLQKFAAVQMDSRLAVQLDHMIKLCLERLNLGTGVGASAAFEAHGTLYLENAPMVVSIENVKTLARAMIEAENGMYMAVEPLVTQVSTSTGRAALPLFAGAGVEGTVKHSLLSLRPALVPEAVLRQIHQVSYIQADAPAVLDAALQSLCYQLCFDASAAVEIAALVLGTEIRHSLGVWYSGTALGAKVTGTNAQKFIAVQALVSVMQEAEGTLVKVLYPQESVSIADAQDLNADLKRHRLLEELDNNTLEDMDDMTLEDLDYVWMT